MAGNLRAQQNLAECFSDVLRKYEFEGGCPHKLAKSVNEEVTDLRRWAGGTKMPAHVFRMLLHALPIHLADELLAGERGLIERQCKPDANALLVASKCSAFSSDIAERHADGEFCHRDRAAAADEAKRLIAELEPIARGV